MRAKYQGSSIKLQVPAIKRNERESAFGACQYIMYQGFCLHSTTALFTAHLCNLMEPLFLLRYVLKLKQIEKYCIASVTDTCASQLLKNYCTLSHEGCKEQQKNI